MNAQIATRRIAPFVFAALIFVCTALPTLAAPSTNIIHVFVPTGSTEIAFFQVPQLGEWYRLMGTGPTTCFQRTEHRGFGVPASVDWSTGIATFAGKEVPGIKLHLVYAEGTLIGYTADVDTTYTNYEADGSLQP